MKVVKLIVGGPISKLALFVYLFFNIYLVNESKGQSQNFYDSLNFAKIQLNQGNINEALQLLDILEESHPGDENVMRVKGQALYWSKDFEKTKSYFKKSIQTYPSQAWIKLDFGRILYELNEFPESEELLKEFLTLEVDYPEAFQMLAEINYWTGGKPNASHAYLNKILAKYPDNEPADRLKREIQWNTAPRIGIQSVFYSDTQIMKYLGFQATAEFYHSALLQPGFLAEYRTYENGESVQIAQASLKSGFVKSGTDLYLRAGVANSSQWGNQELTYGAEIRQKLPADLVLAGSLDQEYYLYTLASIAQPINPLTFRSSFGRETGKNWFGKILFQKSLFEDENWVQTIAAWFLIPVVQTNAIQFSLGYSFNFSDSKEVRFSENLPIENQVGNTGFETVIPGSYTPYFTPINQVMNGVLSKVKVDFNPKFSLSLTGNVGVYARIDNPNMIYYGTTPSTGPGSNPGLGQGPGLGHEPRNQPISQEDIYLILVDQKFSPIDFKASIDWKISPRSTINSSYNYQETIFFNSHLLTFGLKISLWNE